MEWTDDAFVLDARRHGESASIVTLLTPGYGRHAGLVYGGSGNGKARGVYQPGNRLRVTWRGRLAEQLGHYTSELMVPHAATLLDDPLRLAGLQSACAIAEAALPEREPHPAVFAGFEALLLAMQSEYWATIYVKLEVGLLQELGFGLDLVSCALTGTPDDLAFVSPRTGRAVCRVAAEPYAGKLLKLPGFLVPGGALQEATRQDVIDGLVLTAHFLERHVLAPHNKPLPAARTRFVDRLGDINTISGS
jgi:DNA repair protein RecO (recombination protein O)